MNFISKAMVLMLAVMLMFGCSRKGFKDSLNQNTSPSQSSSISDEEEQQQDGEALIFDIDVGEMSDDGVFLYYTLPRAKNPVAEESAEHISEKIHASLFSLQNEIAQGKGTYKLTVFDAITQNNGIQYSTMYQIEYLSKKDAQKENYCFGLAFDSATGELLGLDSIMDVDTFVALISDEQSSKIVEKDEALAAKQRAYLNNQGIEMLKERLSYPDGIVSLERLLDASFYLDGEKLVGVFAAPQDIGGVIKISVLL